MTKEQAEDTIRAVCDSSGLSNTELADVLHALMTGYKMLVEEGEP